MRAWLAAIAMAALASPAVISGALGDEPPGHGAAGTAIEHLRRTHPEAAAIIDARIAQRRAKMKLSAAEGEIAANALRAQLSASAAFRRLAARMPRSAIELARAVAERGLDAAEARRIADYLDQMVTAIEPGNLARLDENHSHVTGRRWREIDYSGERMTWQGQKRYWSPRGVADFRTVAHIDAYFRQASRLRYFRRIYRPRRSMRDFAYRPATEPPTPFGRAPR